MTRRAIDIEDWLWQALKIEAAIAGVTLKEIVNRHLAEDIEDTRALRTEMELHAGEDWHKHPPLEKKP